MRPKREITAHNENSKKTARERNNTKLEMPGHSKIPCDKLRKSGIKRERKMQHETEGETKQESTPAVLRQHEKERERTKQNET